MCECRDEDYYILLVDSYLFTWKRLKPSLRCATT